MNNHTSLARSSAAIKYVPPVGAPWPSWDVGARPRLHGPVSEMLLRKINLPSHDAVVGCYYYYYFLYIPINRP